MFIRKGLLTTVSAIAIAAYAGMPEKARAQDPVLVLEGQAGWTYGDEQIWSFIFPPVQPQRIAPDNIYQGTIGFISSAQDLLPNSPAEWDIGVFAHFGRTNEASSGGLAAYFYNALGGSYPSYYTSGRVQHQETHAFVDFEARRDVGLGEGQGSLTTIVGASFGYLDAQTDTEFIYLPSPTFYTLNEKRESEFIGAGPRFGFERSVPIADYVTFDLGGAASVLFGRRTTSTITDGGLPFISTQIQQSETEIVSRLTGRLGLTFYSPDSPATLGIGVEGRALINAFDQRTNVGFGPILASEENANRFHVSPYVRLTIPLGEGGSAFAFAPSSKLAAEAVSVEDRFGSLDTVAEFEVRGGFVDRGGNAINQFGVNSEDEAFGIAGAGLLLSSPIANNWIVQLEADGETRLDGDGTEDNFESGYAGAAHLAFTNGEFLLGVFGGAGSVDIDSAGTVDQDADFWFYGAQGRMLGKYGSLHAQAGLIDTSSANPETIVDGIFGRFGGKLFSPDGQTTLGADITYIGGTQDSDSLFFPDSVDLISWGVELEHQLPSDLNGNDMTVFASYRNIRIDEDNFAVSADSTNDNLFEAGIRISLGQSSVAKRDHDRAPEVPKFHRLLGAIPAVD